MGKIFMSGIVPQKVAPVTFKPNFADNDWSTIIKACQTNKVPDTWAAGSQKTMTINGTDYLIPFTDADTTNYTDFRILNPGVIPAISGESPTGVALQPGTGGDMIQIVIP